VEDAVAVPPGTLEPFRVLPFEKVSLKNVSATDTPGAATSVKAIRPA